MFLILLNYTQGIEKIEKHLPEHREYLDKYYTLNKFICSGAQIPRTGGVILCNASNIAEVECIVSEDPFSINDVATFKIIEFNPTKYVGEFQQFTQPQIQSGLKQ